MNLRYCPSPDEAMSSDQVLLEHWTTFCGRQLALRVTTADSASPDAVTVQVRYGGGQAEVIVSADEEGDEEECSEARRSAPAVAQTPDMDAGGLVEPKEHCSPMAEGRTGMEDLGRVDGANREISCPQGEEQLIKAPPAVSTTDEVLAPDAEQNEMTASVAGKKRKDEEPPTVAADGQAANASTKHGETSSSKCEERQNSEPLPACPSVMRSKQSISSRRSPPHQPQVKNSNSRLWLWKPPRMLSNWLWEVKKRSLRL